MSQLFLPSSPDTQPSQFSQDDLKFTASLAHVAHLAEILSAITSINSQALMIISDSGITIYAEYNHITNVQVTIDASLFSTFELTGSETTSQASRDMRLGVDIQLISDSFTAAASTSMPRKVGQNGTTISGQETVLCYMKYDGEGHPFVIEFEDRLMSEKIEFYTFYLETDYPYDAPLQLLSHLVIDHEKVQFEVIVKSDLLANLLQDLQHINTQEVYIFVSNVLKGVQRNQLNFISRGAIGYLKLIFPNAKTTLEKLDIFQASGDTLIPSNDSIISCLSFLPFIRVFKAVKLSSKCKFMKDLSGVLLVQLLCKNPGVANYPGTLITFNMLEMSANTDEFGHLGEVDVNGLFEDELYQYIKEYEPASERQEPMREPREPLSYASFRVPTNISAGDDGDDDLELPKRRRKDDNSNTSEFATVGGAVEVPLFL